MNIREYRPKIFNIFSTQWGLVTAGTIDDFNTMTIAWGAMGTVWGTVNEKARDTITVYVNPLRHTFGYMNKNDHRSVIRAFAQKRVRFKLKSFTFLPFASCHE